MSAQRTDRLVILGLAAATALVCLPLLTHLLTKPAPIANDFYSFGAWDRFCILHFGQFPFRSPYYGGGFPTYVSPDDPALTPRMPLILVLGPWAGPKVNFALMMYLSAVGVYLLLRHQMNWPVPAALMSAVTFAFGGFFLHRLLQAQLVTTRSAVFPWVLYAWWRSRRNPRWLIPCAVLMGVVLVDAKYGLAVLVWFMILWMLLRLDRDGGGHVTDSLDVRRFALLGVVITWAFALAAVKLVPFVPVLWTHITIGGQGKAVTWSYASVWVILFAVLAVAPMAAQLRARRRAVAATLAVIAAGLVLVALVCPVNDAPLAERREHLARGLKGLVSFVEMQQEPGYDWSIPADRRWSESSPVGYVGLALAVLAVLFRARQVWRWAFLAALLFAIEVDVAAPINLFESLRRFPVLNVLRNPAPWYNEYLLFCLAVLAGRGAMVPAEWLARKSGDSTGRRTSPSPHPSPCGRGSKGEGFPGMLSPDFRRAIPWALVVANALYLGAAAWPRYAATVTSPLPPLPTRPADEDFYLFHTAEDEPGWLAYLIYRNVGLIFWGKDLHATDFVAVQPRRHHPGGPINPHYRGEVYFLPKGSPNHARFTRFTPLDIRVAVDVKRPGTLCLNQVPDFNWRPSEGRLATETRVLGLHLDRVGEYEVHLRYVPVLFYWGLAVSLAALVFGTVAVLSLSPRRGNRGTA